VLTGHLVASAAQPVELLILGAGLAGLGAGVQARRQGMDSLILEAAPRAGGLCSSTTIHGCEFDYGPKVLLPGDPQVTAELLGFLDGNYETYPMSQQTYLAGIGLTGFPLQRHLADLPPAERDRVLADMKAAWAAPVPVASYRDWLLNSYGRRFCETVMFPYEEKKWQVPLASMSYEWALRRPLGAGRQEILAGAYGRPATAGVYHYPRRGSIAVLSEALAAQAGRILLNTEVTTICPAGRYVVAAGRRYHYRHLISTLPLDRAVVMTDRLDQDLRDRAAQTLRWLSIRVFNLVFAGNCTVDATAVHFPEPDLSFRRVCVLERLCPALGRAGLTPISVEVSLDPRRAEPTMDDQLGVVLRDLAKVPDFSVLGRLLAHQMLTLGWAYPMQHNGLRALVDELHSHYADADIHHCGRGGNFDYCNSDAAYAQGKRAAQLALNLRSASG
jgi:protoporphyrinogen oxidase